jgi:hypothetical protein
MEVFRGKNEPKQPKIKGRTSDKQIAKRQKWKKKTAKVRKRLGASGGRTALNLQIPLRPHLRQAAPNHNRTILYFSFFLAAKPQNPPPFLLPQSGNVFQRNSPPKRAVVDY